MYTFILYEYKMRRDMIVCDTGEIAKKNKIRAKKEQGITLI